MHQNIGNVVQNYNIVYIQYYYIVPSKRKILDTLNTYYNYLLDETIFFLQRSNFKFNKYLNFSVKILSPNK